MKQTLALDKYRTLNFDFADFFLWEEGAYIITRLEQASAQMVSNSKIGKFSR